MLLMVAASAPSPFYPQLAEQLRLLPVATTGIFAVYAFTMLAALLVAGSLSDRVGRRPVVTVGSLLLAGSLLLFWQSGSLGMLLTARAVQGFAAGLLIPALSAMVVDFTPTRATDTASLWNTMSAMTGLGVGAIVAALVLDTVTNPTAIVFGVLAALFILIAAGVWAVPGSSPTPDSGVSRGWGRVSVPSHVRHRLLVAVPAIIAGWATNGLFLALGPAVMKSEFAAATHVQQAITVPLFAVSGIVAAILLHRRSARVVSVYGTAALGTGTALSMAALAVHALPAYLIAVAVVGSGFGTAFMGVLQTLMPQIRATERAAVMAIIYTVSYLAFGVPTIIAGLLVPVISLRGAMTTVGGVIVVLCLIATVTRIRVPDRPHPVLAAPEPGAATNDRREGVMR